ncbi:hypothetical protein [Croceicoccus sediminis]|uniref:hypothetical protein n=1 Tax=Croceicoccus sediminis TaxID=2571150 RepID=UPI0011843038|nr:hypothetical protein [Croceicoccus sediminis]
MKIVGLLLRIGGAGAGVAAVTFIPDAVLGRSIAALGLSGSVDLQMARMVAHGLFGLIGFLMGSQIAAMLRHRPIDPPGNRHDAAESVPRLRRHLVDGEKKQASVVPRYEDPNAAPTKPVAVSFKELGLDHPHVSEYPDPAGEHDDHHDSFVYAEQANRPESAGSADDEWAEFGNAEPPARAQPPAPDPIAPHPVAMDAPPAPQTEERREETAGQWTAPEPFPTAPEAEPIEERPAVAEQAADWNDAPASDDSAFERPAFEAPTFETLPEDAAAEPEPEPAAMPVDEAKPVHAEIQEPIAEPEPETIACEPVTESNPAQTEAAPEPVSEPIPAPEWEPVPAAAMTPVQPAPAESQALQAVQPAADAAPDAYSRVKFAMPSDENWYDGAGDDEEEAEDDGAGYGSLSDIGLGRTHQPRGGDGQRGEAGLPPSEFGNTNVSTAIPKGKPQDFRLREALAELMRVDPSAR